MLELKKRWGRNGDRMMGIKQWGVVQAEADVWGSAQCDADAVVCCSPRSSKILPK
jgi:hypothetical protein